MKIDLGFLLTRNLETLMLLFFTWETIEQLTHRMRNLISKGLQANFAEYNMPHHPLEEKARKVHIILVIQELFKNKYVNTYYVD